MSNPTEGFIDDSYEQAKKDVQQLLENPDSFHAIEIMESIFFDDAPSSYVVEWIYIHKAIVQAHQVLLACNYDKPKSVMLMLAYLTAKKMKDSVNKAIEKGRKEGLDDG